MSSDEWIVIDEAIGSLQAELLRGFLEAQGIQVVLSQEGLGHSVYSVGVGPLARVQILVPSIDEETARKLIEGYYSRSSDQDALSGNQGTLGEPE